MCLSPGPFAAILLATWIAASGAASAQPALIASNQLRVQGTAQEIEVFPRAGRRTGANAFCAASDYARRWLGARMNDRLVMTRALSPSPSDPRWESVSFRLSPAEAGRTQRDGLFLLLRRGVGQSRSVGQGVGLCIAVNS